MKLLLTFSFVFQLLGVACFAPCLFFLLLTLATFVEVLNNDTNKHIENKKPDQKQERNEVDKTPLIVIESWLQKEKKKNQLIFIIYTCLKVPVTVIKTVKCKDTTFKSDMLQVCMTVGNLIKSAITNQLKEPLSMKYVSK